MNSSNTELDVMRSEFYTHLEDSRKTTSKNCAFLTTDKFRTIVEQLQMLRSNKIPKLPRHYALLRSYDYVEEDGSTRLVCPSRGGRPPLYYAQDDELFDILYSTHVKLGHKGRDKMALELKKQYKNITRHDIQTLVDLCHVCKVRRLKREASTATILVPNRTLSYSLNNSTNCYVFVSVPQQQQQQQQQPSPKSSSPVPQMVPKKLAPAPQPQPPPAPPEVCLRWNSYHSNMQATFPSLLNNEQFVDVTLACEGRSIKCHKVMLSACSSYFEELLSQNPCQHPIVFMRDLKFWEVQALVEFMYSGEVNVAQDKLPSLLAAAEALQIKGLTGPSTGSSSHDEDGAGESEEAASVPNAHKRPRKRKTPSTPTFLNKPHNVSPGQFTPKYQQVKTEHRIPPAHQSQIPSTSYAANLSPLQSPRQTPPLSHQPPAKIKREHSPSTSIKLEPSDIPSDYSVDQGDSDTGQNESTNDIGHNSNPDSTMMTKPGDSLGQLKPPHDNGLSDDDQTVSSETSEDRLSAQEGSLSMDTDPGDKIHP